MSRRIFFVVVAALAAGLAAVQWRAGLMLSNDGPQHLHAAFVNAHVDDPAYSYGAYWERVPSIASRGFLEIFGTLHAFLDWQTAYRAALVVLLWCWAFGALAVVAAVCRQRAWLGLLAFPVALQWTFYEGFLPYYFGAGLGLFVVAYVVARASLRWTDAAIVAAAGFIIAPVHPLDALLLAGVVIGVTAFRATKEVPRALVAALPALVMFLAATPDAAATPEPTTWLPWAERAAIVVERLIPGPGWRTAVGPLACALGAWGLVAAQRPLDRAVALAGLGLAAATLVLPWGGGWQLGSPRPLIWAIPLLLAAAPVERLAPRAQAAVAVVVVAWCVAALAWSASFHDRLRSVDERLLEVVAAGPGPRRDIVRIPIVLVPDAAAVPELSDADPAIHVGQIAAIAWGGGFMIYSQAGSAMHSIRPTPALERDSAIPPEPSLVHAARRTQDPVARAALVDAIAAQAAPFDEVVVLGTDADLEVFVRRGYVARARGAGWLIGAAPRCPARVAVHLNRPTVVELGVGGAPSASRSWDVGAGDHDLSVSLPCGPAWLQVAGVSCLEAGEGGRISVNAVSSETVSLTCTTPLPRAGP